MVSEHRVHACSSMDGLNANKNFPEEIHESIQEKKKKRVHIIHYNITGKKS